MLHLDSSPLGFQIFPPHFWVSISLGETSEVPLAGAIQTQGETFHLPTVLWVCKPLHFGFHDLTEHSGLLGHGAAADADPFPAGEVVHARHFCRGVILKFGYESQHLVRQEKIVGRFKSWQCVFFYMKFSFLVPCSIHFTAGKASGKNSCHSTHLG